MRRWSFLRLGGCAALGLMPGAPMQALPFQVEKRRFKIDSVRLVRTRPKPPVPAYTPQRPIEFSLSQEGIHIILPT